MKRPWSEYRPARAMMACPQCRMPAGKQCRTHGGTRAKTGDHVARWTAWCKAGRPMPPAEPVRPFAGALEEALRRPGSRPRLPPPMKRPRLPRLTDRVLRGLDRALDLANAEMDSDEGRWTVEEHGEVGAANLWVRAQMAHRARRRERTP